jgi:predicted porin
MKLSFMSAAVLTAVSMSANAQSTVTLFGVVDAAVTFGNGSGAGSSDRRSLTSGAYNTSRIGFRGVEDLGAGMSASFWLEAGVNVDNGTGGGNSVVNNQASGGSATGTCTVAGATPAVVGVPVTCTSTVALNGTQGLTFARRSTVSLSGPWGEVRLGRDYDPQFWNLNVFDPFGSVGVGVSLAHINAYGANPIGGGGPYARGGGVNGLGVRSSNGIGYFLPRNLGGFYGQAQYFLGENPQNGAATEDDGTGFGLRVGFASGPFNVAAAYQDSEFAAGDVRTFNIGGSWDFGVARAMAVFNRDRIPGRSDTSWSLGALVPVGPGEIRVSYSQLTVDLGATEPKARKMALGYVHNLSKRTAVYTTVARVRNSGGQSIALGGATTAVNASSTGFDLGLRHSF